MKSQNAINGKKKTVAIIKELIPRLVINQKIEGINAIVAEQGGKTSHAAILCRAFGIPTVIGIKNIHLSVTNQSRILVDGISGKVVINPLEPTIYQIPTKSSLPSKPRKKAKESDKGFYIMANINFATEVIDAKKAYAGGIGLYRTEFEFMLAGSFLDEDEQFVRYKNVIKAMNGLPVYIRFLDLGRDKNVTDLIFTGENFLKTNSFGAQFLLDNIEVFTVQAKAIARASQYGPVSIVYPMITGVNQFLLLRRLFNQKTKEITSGKIKHGVMFEVPSACLAAREILKFADFGHIGTNDLISILLGFKRDSKNDFPQQAVQHPMFWTLLTNVARAARSNDKPLMVCGELAKDYQFIKKIRKLKINCISISPKYILPIRNRLNESHQLAEIR